MRHARIIHQQIRQIVWQFFVCFGLVMVLPIEEAAVNYRDGDGFYSSNFIVPAVMISILLAGLIACSNIQADYKQSRYIFWQSKPVRTKLFIALKYFVGLFAALIILLCPVVFGFITSTLCGEEFLQGQEKDFVVIPIFLALMTYSLCFACSILIRKTARGWLVGLALSSLGLLLCVLLLFAPKESDMHIEQYMLRVFISVTCTISVGAFIFALIAGARNWHLKTNLKGLLWVASILIFSLMMFYGSQIANIKVLDELEIDKERMHFLSKYIGGSKLLDSFIDIDNDQIVVKPAFEDFTVFWRGEVRKSLKAAYDLEESYFVSFDYNERISAEIDGVEHFFDIALCYRVENGRCKYEKVFLTCSVFEGNQMRTVSIINLSDCLKDNQGNIPNTLMRQFDNKIAVLINSSWALIDISSRGSIKVIEKEINPIKFYPLHYKKSLNKEWSLPLIDIAGLSEYDSAKLSVEFHIKSKTGQPYRGFSIYDTVDSNTGFCFSADDLIMTGEITRWDDEKVYCQLTASRPFTALERLTGFQGYCRIIVQDLTLYAYFRGELMVFDIRTTGKIRKLGHFVRNRSEIMRIEVLRNGDILMMRGWEDRFSDANLDRFFLTLLENPRR